MVKKPLNKHTKIAVTVVVSAVILYAVMSIIDNIGLVYGSVADAVAFVSRLIRPVLIGFIIAFLLYRPAEAIGRLLRRTKFFSKHQRGAQVLGVFIAFFIFIMLIVLFIYIMVPSIVQSVKSISQDIPRFAQSTDHLLYNLSQNAGVAQVFDFIGIDVATTNSINKIIAEFWTEITGLLQNATTWLFGFIVNTGLFVYNFLLGLFFSVYMLLFKDQLRNQIKRLSKGIFRGFYYRLAFTYKVGDGMFNKFIVGKGICSIGIGIATFILCTIFGFRYSPLISLIVAVTNMVPTFGPFIGAIPAVLLAMMTAPIYGLYIIIIIVVLQIIEGNIIGPRVLGESMGLNGFWIIFSIIIMGGLFGVIGMLIAAPLFGMLRILIKNWLVRRETGGEKLNNEQQYMTSLQRYQQWTTKKPKKSKKQAAS